MSDDEAMTRLTEHASGELDPDRLRQPRIVLIATAFPSTVTATVVWLHEMGLDMSLVRLQAYRVENERVIGSVSQLYPVPDIEDFTVAPVRASARRARGGEYAEHPWTADDLQQVADVITNPTVLAAMALCSEQPGRWVSIREVETKAGRTLDQVKGDLAGLTTMVKRRFERSNWPFIVKWAAGGEENAYYQLDPATAQIWTEITQSAAPDTSTDPSPPWTSASPTAPHPCR